MLLKLDEHLQRSWHNRDVFELVQQIEGKVYKEKDNRRVIRFESTGRPLFLKIHRGVGWGEIFKNLLHLRLPVIGATNEWRAVNYLQALGINTMTAVGFGKKGLNPADQLSFLITEELRDTITLEQFCGAWAQQRPPFKLRQSILKELARIARVMHKGGVNHRDFYLCHFLMAKSGFGNAKQQPPKIFLVDLHRAQIRNKVPLRWRVKDIGSLYFSALDIGLSKRDIFRFIRLYADQPLRQSLSGELRFWRLAQQRAIKLYRKAHGCEPMLPIRIGSP